MTGNYNEQVENLTHWYKQRLPVCGPFVLTYDQYAAGVDSLTGKHAQLRDAGFIEWQAIKSYELSYNQGCVAFFTAANALKLLTIIG